MHLMLDNEKLEYCITLYGKPRRQEKRQQTLLLRRRKCPRRRQAPHRPSGLSRHRRKTRRDGPRSHRPRPPGRHHPRVRLARRPWAAAQQTGVWDLLQSLWPSPAPDPRPLTISCWPPSTASASPAPKPKSPTGIAPPSCRRCGSFPPNALLRRLSGTPSNRSCRKATEALSPADDPLEQAQLRLLGVWKEKQLVSRRLLAYDTTNFYTYIASSNTAINWPSADTTSRAAITCGKWV